MEHEVHGFEQLREGSLRQVECDGNKVLLARVGGRCHAVGTTCPHAGGPLAEGVLHGEVVVCPWHKAAFRVTDGRRVEPPALDDLPAFSAREEGGRLFVGDAPAPARAAPAVDGRCFVIVGAGAAGASAAQTLREEGFSGRVVLVGREDRLPYDRTVLSKYALSGKQGGEKTPLQDAAFYDRHRIEFFAREVSGIDPATRRVTFADGGTLAYDAALVATGGVPRPLDVPGADVAGVFLLRTPEDAAGIAAAAETAREVVVVGGGFIGVEAAASLRERGLGVTVVVPQSEPFERQLGAEVGSVFRRFHERQGVRFRLGQEVARIEGDDRVRAVVLKDGTRLPADLVVAGLGVAPATGLVQGVARREDGGLATDSRLRIADGLFAAGDVAAFPLRGTGAPVRVEHWRVAEQHGRVAALNMLGQDVAFDAVPYFWTIHFMQRLDYVGHAERWDDVVMEGDTEAPSFLAYYVAEGRVAALAGWRRDRQMAAAIHLMTERRDWTQPALREALREWAG